MEDNIFILNYVAGLFDGEGCIVVALQKPTPKNQLQSTIHWLQVAIAMSHQPTMEWLKGCFGGCIVTDKKGKSRGDRRPHYSWRVQGNQAKDFLLKIIPFLRYKKEQALLAIDFQTKKQEQKGKPYVKLPDIIVQEREEYRNRLRRMTNGKMSVTGYQNSF
ncbi:hypothetical protein LCGC14_0399280 [marine sediment metagenome]|uniref:Homing endonuclease LAGLIDADG domain-containing protein n=1 Tax=marine sediment metagenome TaxID=412755 RepID=A0A0F9TFI8_9ZZZZ